MSCSFPGKDEEDDDHVKINWTRPMLERFKLIVTKADEAKVEQVVFDGHPFLVSYAKYLIQYLEGKLNGNKKS